ncbi:sulfotransferase family 5A, member 1 [Corythoichthys intestinalis]|uniref:sulfotransferase family 5A, member 1 n=1 Tax=Corythoichthys intestinalis TaxID=161448 RepID=UPI0025A5FF58|nr:sulfotransferase family 5A, member 1 [Corythoichthys intestinalis]XP_061796730.1 sulfotransferase 2B1-like [Nerophis lumbriciformis]
MSRLEVIETFHGITFPGHLHTQESLQLALEFPFHDTDILIVSYPKSGTTWMQQLLTLILNRGDPFESQKVPNWVRAPWLEHHYSATLLDALRQPRIITTHLPHNLLAGALRGSNVKVIYVSRNPKDVAVSFYHFHKMANFLPNFSSFQEFLNAFLEGTVHFGSWFDHFKGWTTGQTGAMTNLLHVTYEEMSMDFEAAIVKVTSFLQRPLAEDEVNSCLRHCSFSSMKDNKMVNYTDIPPEIMDHSKGCFMRRGKVGDWRNMLTNEQNERFERDLKEKMQDCSLEFVWE